MNNVFHILRPNNKQWDRRIFIVLAVVYTALIADISISSIADFPNVISFATSVVGIAIFISIVLVTIVGLHLIPKYLKTPRESEHVLSSKIRVSFIIHLIQYILAAIIIVITLQILFSSSYSTLGLIAVTSLSYGVAAFLMGVLCLRLFTWFRYNKSIITLIFAITALLITINAIASLIFFDERLSAKDSTLITPESEVVYEVGFEPGTAIFVIHWIMMVSWSLYFVSSWVGTVSLLLHHRKRVGNLRFWTLVVLPIIFLMYFFIRLYLLTDPESFLLTSFDMGSFLFFTYAIALLGILIGIGFYSVGRAINQNIDVRNYMLVTAYGFVLFFIAAGATVIQTGYPPFGLPNVSFVGLSSFLIFTGLYSSAISISRDVQLRKFIKESVYDEAKFLASIGTAQMQQEMENKVTAITKNKMVEAYENSHLAPSLTDEEVRSYINEVIKEVKLKKPSSEPLD